jgi:hypothetical protein
VAARGRSASPAAGRHAGGVPAVAPACCRARHRRAPTAVRPAACRIRRRVAAVIVDDERAGRLPGGLLQIQIGRAAVRPQPDDAQVTAPLAASRPPGVTGGARAAAVVAALRCARCRPGQCAGQGAEAREDPAAHPPRQTLAKIGTPSGPVRSAARSGRAGSWPRRRPKRGWRRQCGAAVVEEQLAGCPDCRRRRCAPRRRVHIGAAA